MTNFALTDAAGIAIAFLLFAPLTLAPGYLIASLLQPWQFRTRSFAFQLATSLPLSLASGPILTFLLASLTNLTTVIVLYFPAALASLIILIRHPPRLDKTAKLALAAGLGFSTFAALWLMDWQFSARAYFPIYAFDNGTRAAFVHSLAFFGLPAQTPFFNPSHPVAMHYHLFWFLQCALIHRLAPLLIPARIALIAGSIWCALGLLCICALTMRLFHKSRSWIALALLTLTGFDFIPTFAGLLTTRMHIASLLHTALWQPHYACALIACFTGTLLLLESPRLISSFIAACCFATAVGSGTFVALVFAVFLAVWVALNLRNSQPFLIAGFFAALFSLPYLSIVRAPSQNIGGQALFHFIPSPFSPVQMPVVLKLAELPIYYFLEFGVLIVCGILAYRNAHRMFIVMALTSLAVCTFVESTATPNNDLGWRGFMLTQFALTILAAAYLERIRPANWIKILVALGILATGYDLFLNRFFPILSDYHQGPKPAWLGADQQLGARTLAHREAYAWLQLHSKPTAIIALNPDVEAIDPFSGLYADRNLLAGDRTCTIGFGGSAAECAPIVALLSNVYTGNAPPAPLADFYIVKDTDPVWREPHSWNWTTTPAFANQFVRIFAISRSYN